MKTLGGKYLTRRLLQCIRYMFKKKSDSLSETCASVATNYWLFCAVVISCRRKLKADISAAFPSLSAEEVAELVPNKEDLNVVKIYANKGDSVTLYVLHKNPLFFELGKHLYPTGDTLETQRPLLSILFTPVLWYISVYMLWRFPAALPTFRTWPPVLQKLIGGAGMLLFVCTHVKKKKHLTWKLHWLDPDTVLRPHAAGCGDVFKRPSRCATRRQLRCYSRQQ